MTKVLVGKVEKRLKQLIEKKSEQLCNVIALEVMLDHVHLKSAGSPHSLEMGLMLLK